MLRVALEELWRRGPILPHRKVADRASQMQSASRAPCNVANRSRFICTCLAAVFQMRECTASNTNTITRETAALPESRQRGRSCLSAQNEDTKRSTGMHSAVHTGTTMNKESSQLTGHCWLRHSHLNSCRTSMSRTISSVSTDFVP